MKGYLLVTAIACVLPFVANAQNDIYYIPSQEVEEVTVTKATQPTVSRSERTARYYDENRNVDEYNRRSKSTYSEESTNYDNEEDAAETDNYSYSKRIIRFHGPAGSFVVSSPYYWDVCYNDVWDVYYDGWAFGLPSYRYWTYAYDPWYYNHWYYRTCWDYTWGWYDPWWGSSYWGWHHPRYWGWDRPYYGGWAAHWHTPHHWAPLHHAGHGMAPGFGHASGGGRMMARGNEQVRQGSAGGWIRQGGSSRTVQTGNNASAPSRRTSGRGAGLTKSFRTGSFTGNADNAIQANSNTMRSSSAGSRSNSSGVRSGGGGFSRNSSSGYTRPSTSTGRVIGSSSSSSNSRTSRSSGTVSRSQSSSQSSRSYTPSSSSSSRSYTPSSSSSSSRSSGFSGGSGGGGRSGGGGFSGGGGGGGRSGGGGGGRR